jgi:hypothetical protein
MKKPLDGVDKRTYIKVKKSQRQFEGGLNDEHAAGHVV